MKAWRGTGQGLIGTLFSSTFSSSEWNLAIGTGAQLFVKLDSLPIKLGQIAKIFVGLQTSADTVFLFKNSQLTETADAFYSNALGRTIEIEANLLKPVVRSGSIGRYWATATAQVLFPYRTVTDKFHLIQETEMKRDFPKSWDYLNANKTLLAGREHGKFIPSGWYQLYPKNLDIWEQNKILVPYMVTRLSAYYDEKLLVQISTVVTLLQTNSF